MIEDDAALPSGSIVAMRIFNSVAIGQRADGYLNATAMCKASGKKWGDYARTAETKAFLSELSSALDIPLEAKPQISGIQQNQSLIWSKQGPAEHGGGTWVQVGPVSVRAADHTHHWRTKTTRQWYWGTRWNISSPKDWFFPHPLMPN